MRHLSTGEQRDCACRSALPPSMRGRATAEHGDPDAEPVVHRAPSPVGREQCPRCSKAGQQVLGRPDAASDGPGGDPQPHGRRDRGSAPRAIVTG